MLTGIRRHSDSLEPLWNPEGTSESREEKENVFILGFVS